MNCVANGVRAAAWAVLLLTLSFFIWRGVSEHDTRAEMARVEQLLDGHGVDVVGFAAGDTPDLALADALAPAGCAEIMRAGWLARLAIRRHAPERLPAAAELAAGVQAAIAQDLDQLGCLPVTQP